MSLYYLDVRKTVQAVGVILDAVPGRVQLEYIAIIKLLYIADRESLRETGSSITGDAPCAMKNGPVLSGVFDLVKSHWERDLAYWVEFIQRDEYDLILKKDPGTDLLSDYEVQKLMEIARRHKKDDWRKLIKITHKFPEWIANDPDEYGCNMKPIPLEDILKAVGREKDIEEIKNDLASAVAMHRTFGR